jgi:uncharacterized protein (DUF1330 family)
VLDAAALAAYVPQAQAAVRGGRWSARDRPGERKPPKRFGVSEWETLEKAQTWYNSAERKALTPQREKAFKITRQYMVEGPPN